MYKYFFYQFTVSQIILCSLAQCYSRSFRCAPQCKTCAASQNIRNRASNPNFRPTGAKPKKAHGKLDQTTQPRFSYSRSCCISTCTLAKVTLVIFHGSHQISGSPPATPCIEPANPPNPSQTLGLSSIRPPPPSSSPLPSAAPSNLYCTSAPHHHRITSSRRKFS